MAYTVIIDDNFTRANTTPNAAANSTNVTGPATFNSPGSNAPYIDLEGTHWAITNNSLGAVNEGVNSFSTGLLLRPSAEAVRDGQAAVTFTLGSVGPAAVVFGRWVSGTGCYAASMYLTAGSGAPVFSITKLGTTGGAQTVLTSSGTGTFDSTTSYVMTLALSGASPTTLTATIATAAAPGTAIATLSATDSTAALQVAGQWGVSANSSGSTVSTVAFTHLTTYQGTPAVGLTMGGLTTSSAPGGNIVYLASGLSNGSGSGYSYAIHGGDTPNFTPSSATLLSTTATPPLVATPYFDTAATPGRVRYYGILGTDSAGNTVWALPTVFSDATAATPPLFASALTPDQGQAIVFLGDSITYGAGVSGAGGVATPTMPGYALAKLASLNTTRKFVGKNIGVSGTTLTDWTTSSYTSSRSGVAAFVAANPGAQVLFSIMLGGNDSASSGTNNNPSGTLSPANYSAKVTTLVGLILADYPSALIVFHMPTSYSPNFRNTSTYGQAGLAALYSYRAALLTAIGTINNPRVKLGDTSAFGIFAAAQTALCQAESGGWGTFYVHPSGVAGSDGRIGTQVLGELHATAITQAIYGRSQAVSTFY